MCEYAESSEAGPRGCCLLGLERERACAGARTQVTGPVWPDWAERHGTGLACGPSIPRPARVTEVAGVGDVMRVRVVPMVLKLKLGLSPPAACLPACLLPQVNLRWSSRCWVEVGDCSQPCPSRRGSCPANQPRDDQLPPRPVELSRRGCEHVIGYCGVKWVVAKKVHPIHGSGRVYGLPSAFAALLPLVDLHGTEYMDISMDVLLAIPSLNRWVPVTPCRPSWMEEHRQFALAGLPSPALGPQASYETSLSIAALYPCIGGWGGMCPRTGKGHLSRSLVLR